MRLKLISPRMNLRPMDSEYKRVMSPSLALLTLGALTPRQHTIEIADENTGPIRLNDQPDLVGITVNVDTSRRAYALARHYRNRGIKVILGGIHVSANPEEALQYADAVCIGEAEELWARILADALQGRLQPRYFNPQATDLDHYVVPRWELINQSRYLYTNILCASRGCPFQCEFCYNSCDYVHHQYRSRSIANIIAEIETWGTKHVMFIDDNLIGDIEWTKKFVKAITPLGLRWNAAVSANLGEHLDLLDQMKLSGCKSLFIGLESINSRSIASVRKYQNHRPSYEKLLREIHDRSIMVNASLAFGFDHDYPDVFQQTLAWLVEQKVETMTAHILTPYPGTVFYRKLLQQGRIVDFDWTHYNTAHPVFTPQNMTRQELATGYLWIYQQFYSLNNILKRLPLDHQQWVPYLLFNLGYRKFGRITSTVARLGLMDQVGRLARRLSYGVG